MYNFWHSYNRGVEKRNIFLTQEDYFRSVHNIYEFNNEDAIVNSHRRFSNFKNRNQDNGKNCENDGNRIPINKKMLVRKPRNLLVDLFTWCLMPNHYHLFSSPRDKDSLAKFHQKLGIGYTNYFNLKNKREGTLFQGKYKKIQVLSDNQAAHLVCYIHSNPLKLWKPKWKERGLDNLEIKDALNFLNKKENRWSSHQDYWGIKNFPSLINTDFLFKFFNGFKGYQDFFVNWLKQYQKNILDLQKLIID